MSKHLKDETSMYINAVRTLCVSSCMEGCVSAIYVYLFVALSSACVESKHVVAQVFFARFNHICISETFSSGLYLISRNELYGGHTHFDQCNLILCLRA